IDPAKTPSEITLSEPYMVGSHAAACGAWVSGPEDVAPKEYFWGYNRMTTIKGLFAAGAAVGASAHKFSSGPFTAGPLAGKAAVAYIADHRGSPKLDGDRIESLKVALYQPHDVFEANKHATTQDDVNPNYLLPKQALIRLQKIMDEYCAGPGSYYMTNQPT